MLSLLIAVVGCTAVALYARHARRAALHEEWMDMQRWYYMRHGHWYTPSAEAGC